LGGAALPAAAKPYGDSHPYDFLVQHGRRLRVVKSTVEDPNNTRCSGHSWSGQCDAARYTWAAGRAWRPPLHGDCAMQEGCRTRVSDPDGAISDRPVYLPRESGIAQKY
jgi:hypothetical protein